MNKASYEDSLMGEHIGVDVGGSGVRVALFRRAAVGDPWECTAQSEAPHSSGPLARTVALLIASVLRPGASQAPHAEREHAASSRGVFVGLAAPGHKTHDGRGIAQARNLPGATSLLDDLAHELTVRGTTCFDLCTRIASDADAALWGETVIRGGALVGARDALFIGVGSGLAEAYMRGGVLIRDAGPRARELPAWVADGRFSDREDELSLSGLERTLARLQGPSTIGIETAALNGNPAAVELLQRFGRSLADLITLRLEAGLWTSPTHPAVLVRTRRGSFFCARAVRSVVLPALRTAAQAGGARLLESDAPLNPHAACAGALDLALSPGSRPPPSLPIH